MKERTEKTHEFVIWAFGSHGLGKHRNLNKIPMFFFKTKIKEKNSMFFLCFVLLNQTDKWCHHSKIFNSFILFLTEPLLLF